MKYLSVQSSSSSAACWLERITFSSTSQATSEPKSFSEGERWPFSTLIQPGVETNPYEPMASWETPAALRSSRSRCPTVRSVPVANAVRFLLPAFVG